MPIKCQGSCCGKQKGQIKDPGLGFASPADSKYLSLQISRLVANYQP
jgi:hypothetical protein